MWDIPIHGVFIAEREFNHSIITTVPYALSHVCMPGYKFPAHSQLFKLSVFRFDFLPLFPIYRPDSVTKPFIHLVYHAFHICRSKVFTHPLINCVNFNALYSFPHPLLLDVSSFNFCNDRNCIPDTLLICATLVFSRITFRKSLPSIYGMIFSKVLIALFVLLHKIIQSSA